MMNGAGDYLMKKAWDAWDQGQMAKADKFYGQASGIVALNTNYYDARTWFYLAESSLDQAAQAARSAKDLDPGLSRVSYDLGYVEAKSSRFPEAIADYEKAISLDGYNRPRYYYDLAVLYGQQGSNDEALTLLQKLADIYTPQVMQSDMPSRDVVRDDVVRCYRLLGNLYTTSGQPTLATQINSAADMIQSGQ